MADDFVLSGRVCVNNKVVLTPGTMIKNGDIVTVDSNIIKNEEKVYIMLNKPKGYITTASEQFGRNTVLDIIKEKDKRLFPVGRLDMYSEGLLLITNDGGFTNKIIHPTKHIKKTYEVLLNREISDEDISKLENGVDIGDYITKPSEVEKISKGKIRITIYEGKNRQVRRMIDSIGLKVLNLKRINIGSLGLGTLKLGEYRYLNNNDIEKIFK